MLLSTSSAAGGTGALLSLVIPLAIFLSVNVLHDHETSEERTAESKEYAGSHGSRRYSGDYQWFLRSPDQHYREDVIVEFGNNRNCRIPMRKSAIAEVEKASDGIAE